MKIKFFEREKDNGNESIVEYLEDCYKQADLVQKQYEPQWATNASFLEGKQWRTVINEDLRRFDMVEKGAPQTKVKIASNQILPLARQAVAAINENLSEQIAVPQTSDQNDIYTASVATDFLRSKFLEDAEQELRFNEILGAMVFGRMLRKTIWNPKKDSVSGSGKIVKIGDIENASLDPSRFLQCPHDRGSSTQSWVIECNIMDVDEVNDKWPGHEVTAEEISTSVFSSGRLSANVVFGGEFTPAPKNACLLKQMYIRPTWDTPKGKYYVWADHKLLANDDLPNGIFPFVCIDWLPIINKAYPLAFITNLIDPQREMNITYSQLVELKNRQMRGDIAVQGTGEVIQEILPSGQKVVRVSSEATKWEFLKYDLNSTDAEVLLGKLWNDMMMIAGVRESSLGKQVNAGTPATTMMLTKESDMAGLQLFRKGFDLAYCKVSQTKIELAHSNYKVPRLIKVVGELNMPKVTAFLGSDLRGVKDVVPRATPIVSETLKQQLIRESVQQQLYGPYVSPQDKLAKIRALLASGIPGIQEEVDKQLAPMNLDELIKMCSELDMLQAKAQVLQLQTAIMQMESMINPQPEEQPILDQDGEPIPQEQPMLPASQGQPIQNRQQAQPVPA